jgi:hypothetical protein
MLSNFYTVAYFYSTYFLFLLLVLMKIENVDKYQGYFSDSAYSKLLFGEELMYTVLIPGCKLCCYMLH